MNYVGIDIGSTASKAVIMDEISILHNYTLPTGWNCKETSENIKDELIKLGIDFSRDKVVATGYGRISVPYADKVVSEITCHGIGGQYLYEDNATIIDIGGQDTKIITLKNGKVNDFLMNDKCSAGTGKFIEIMANRLGLSIKELCELSLKGDAVKINSMCTVFAESEIIGFIGKGEPRENIAAGILKSVVSKVESLASRHGIAENCYLTGGLSQSGEILRLLSAEIGQDVKSCSFGRYAGAIGAAVIAKTIDDKPVT